MKRCSIVALLLVICFSFFSLNVAAVGYEFKNKDITINLDEKYTVLTSSNLKKHTALVKAMGHSPESLKGIMESSGVVFLATAENNHHQIQLKKLETAFSRDMKDIDTATSEQLKVLGDSMFQNEYEMISANGALYFKTKYSDKNVNSAQYTTIKGGIVYTLAYYGNEPQELENALNELKINSKKPRSLWSTAQIVQIVMIGIGMAAVVAVIVVIIISITRDLRKKEDNDVREFIKIKRRKY